MVSNLIFSYSQWFYILLVPAFAFYNSANVAGGLASEDWGKKVIKYFGLLHVPGNQVSCFLWRGPTFFLVFFLSLTYWEKFLLLPLAALSKLNSISALAFLIWPLAAHTISLYSSQATFPCFHPLQAYILCLNLSRNSLFILEGLLALLPDFLFVRMHCLWPRREDPWILSRFLGPLFPMQVFIPQYSTIMLSLQQLSGPSTHVDQRLGTWGCSYLSTEGLIYLVFLFRSPL